MDGKPSAVPNIAGRGGYSKPMAFVSLFVLAAMNTAGWTISIIAILIAMAIAWRAFGSDR